jgi:hypothetical protein
MSISLFPLWFLSRIVAMKLVAYSLDDTPPMGDGVFIVVHVNLALVAFISNTCVVLAKGLVGTGDRIKAHRLP